MQVASEVFRFFQIPNQEFADSIVHRTRISDCIDDSLGI
jgi:hypothetical protein